MKNEMLDHVSYDRPVRDLRKVRTYEALGLVNVHEAMFLLAFYDGGDMPMSEAASIVGISRAATTSMTDRLSASALIQRTPGADDRRITNVGLTDKGVTLVAHALNFKDEEVVA